MSEVPGERVVPGRCIPGNQTVYDDVMNAFVALNSGLTYIVEFVCMLMTRKRKL